MMESCLNTGPERQQVDVEDVKRDLSSEFSVAPASCCAQGGEHLRVYLRVRPFTSTESAGGESQDCVSIEPPDTVLLRPPRLSLPTTADRSLPHTGQRFQFSQVYGPDTTQRELFEGTVKDLVKDVLRGENSLVFTYGVTNAGKTFTFLGPNDDVGVLPRTLALIFSSISQQVFPGTSIKPHRCREFTRLSPEQQDQEALFKRSLLRPLRETEKNTSSSLKSSDRSNSEGSSLLGWSVSSEDDSAVELEADSRFSVWVSFCEIYNENIHDLLEAAPCGAGRRAALRLSQDVKGNCFVKDLRWVQVNNAEEAHRVLLVGKRNQSFSSTRLNHLSSRSHSIFSIRVLRIEDVGSPRVQTVSELCLCDLAGSERCGKTQNNGERLKEAGNINTSLLILGKCINALRHNQKARLLQHVPFRESKLTHYLQGFFRGHGKACMIVNINQCASMFDETLNVLKFSAVAQKVVVLTSRPPPVVAQRDSSEISILINSADWEGRGHGRRSSLIGWESSLEDVLEDEDCDDEDEEEEEEVEQTVLEETLNLSDDDEKIVVSRNKLQRQGALLEQLREQLRAERAQTLLMEARVREDISREFSELFDQMQSDYSERLARETEILEERAEHRLKIFQELVQKMSSGDGSQDQKAMEDTAGPSRTSAPDDGVCSRSKAPSGPGGGAGVDRAEDGDGLRLEAGLEEKSSDLLRLQRRVSELQKQLDQECRSSQEAAAALQEERRGREESAAALGKEEQENRRRRQEETALRRQLTEAADKLEAAERQVEVEARRARRAEEQQEQQEEQVGALSLQVERLKQELQASSISSACQEDRLREQAAGLRGDLDQERLRLQDFSKQVEQLRRECRDREESSRQQLEELRAELQQAAEEAEGLREQLQHRLGEQGGGAKAPDSSPLAEDLRRMNSDLQAEVSSLRATVSRLQESSTSPGLTPSAAMQQQQVEALQEKEQQVEALQEKLQQQVEALQEKEQQVEALQEKLQQQEQQESHALQEARRREAERRRELLAASQEALALKEEALQRNVQEISRLKESLALDSQEGRSLRAELQRKGEESSDLRDKLADYKKQVQQVHTEVAAMKAEEKTLRLKLGEAEKTRKQLQSDLGLRDRTIQQLRTELSSIATRDQNHQLDQETRQDLQAKEQVMEGMRLVLTEQELTQERMEEALEEKLRLVQELSSELEKLRATLSQQDLQDTPVKPDEAAPDGLKTLAQKHQEERRRWQEERMSLIGQAKAAEERRNQEMRKFIEDRERHSRQQSQLEAQLAEKQQTMDAWKTDRDALVAALEVQLKKLLSSQAEKDQTIQQLSRSRPDPPAEEQKDAEIQRLKDELETFRASQAKGPAACGGSEGQLSVCSQTSPQASPQAPPQTSPQASPGCPAVLESSEVSTEGGRTRRFPQPELEISFSPLRPDRMALRRQGERHAVTVKIGRSARKRKSAEMEKDESEQENRRNRSKLNTHQEESHGTKKEGTLQKIGDFLQSSPTLLGSKAKKMMSLVSGRGDTDAASSSSSSSSSRSLRVKRSKRKLYNPEISSPMEIPPHPMVSREPKESDHQVMKRRLRCRTAK